MNKTHSLNCFNMEEVVDFKKIDTHKMIKKTKNIVNEKYCVAFVNCVT
jgi:hypothetical protein